MHLGDTITAIATGPAPAPRALVRLSGPAAAEAVRSLLAHPGAAGPLAEPLRRGAGRVRLVVPPRDARNARARPSGGNDLGGITAVAIVMPAPRSYTGETSVELLVPGGPVFTRRLLAALLDHPDVRQAGPGEFSARAVLNGRLTPEQAEGVGQLIHAASDAERRAAQELLRGHAGRLYDRLAADLAEALALVEAGIDFTDQEDVVAIAPGELANRLARLVGDIGERLGGDAGAERPTHLPVVALVGSPNAGKSTLFNALLNKTRAVVSATPGATRDAIREPLVVNPDCAPSLAEPTAWATEADPTRPRDRNGVEAFAAEADREGAVAELVDLAGLDEAFDGSNFRGCDAANEATTTETDADAAAQRAARDVIETAHVLLWCDPTGDFDAASPVGLAIEHAREREPTAALIRVRTKADLLGSSTFDGPPPEDAAAADGSNAATPVCAFDGLGLPALRRAVIDAAERAAAPDAAAHLVARHRTALARTLDPLRLAAEFAAAHRHERHLPEPELTAGLLRDALDHLGQIAGQISPDDIIGRVFATFCIGK